MIDSLTLDRADEAVSARGIVRPVAREVTRRGHQLASVGAPACTDSGDSKLRVLVVGTGIGGGIGRYETVLERALQQGDWCRPEFLYRRSHPDYLQRGDPGSSRAALNPTRFTRDVLTAARQLRPHVVIYTHVNLARMSRLVGRIGPPAPFIVCAHGVEVWRALPWTLSDGLRRASRVIAPSEFTASVLGDAGVAATVVRETLEPEWFSTPPPAVGREEPVRIVTVSRLEPTEAGKRIDWLVKAMPRVLATDASARLTIVGRGEAKESLAALARGSGVAHAVDFQGSVGAEELREVYSRSAIFALPSEKEGFGLAHLEAMAAARPVIGGRAGATPELVLDGVTGILVSSASECEAALVRLATDPELRESLGAAARERATQHFGFKRYERSMRTLVEDLAR